LCVCRRFAGWRAGIGRWMVTETQAHKEADVREALRLLVEARRLVEFHGYKEQAATIDFVADRVGEAAGVAL
jgi:hypothetical protein